MDMGVLTLTCSILTQPQDVLVVPSFPLVYPSCGLLVISLWLLLYHQASPEGSSASLELPTRASLNGRALDHIPTDTPIESRTLARITGFMLAPTNNLDVELELTCPDGAL
ncbi:hypothetical protein DFH29DRAFT_1006475 [Suillus ampliporus]|nr:hypothetical protein DFH29DRAFT_1006475 [Suillus ampliporus]